MNYLTYYTNGEVSAMMFAARSPGNEHAMPVFGEGKSWQHKAFAQGFNDKCEKIKEQNNAS